MLSAKLGTQVSIRGVSIGLLNRVDVDSILVMDQSGQPMLCARHLGVRLEMMPLLRKELVVKHAGLYDCKVRLYRATDGAKPNYQFLLDSLSGSSGSQGPKLKFSARSFICRNVDLRYDILNAFQTPGWLNPRHIHLSEVNGNFRTESLRHDDLDIRVRQLQFKEQSGLQLKRLRCHVLLAGQDLTVRHLDLRLPHSSLQIPQLTARLQRGQEHVRQFRARGTLSPSDFSCLMPNLRQSGSDLLADQSVLSYDIQAQEVRRAVGPVAGHPIDIQVRIHDSHRQSLSVDAQGRLYQDFIHGRPLRLAGHLAQLSVSPQTTTALLTLIPQGQGLRQQVAALGQVQQSADFSLLGTRLRLKGQTRCDAGIIDEQLDCFGPRLQASLRLNGVRWDKFCPDSLQPRWSAQTPLPASGTVTAAGTLSPLDLHMTADLRQLSLHGYPYARVQADGHLTARHLQAQLDVDDPNARARAEVETDLIEGPRNIRLTADVSMLKPKALHLSSRYGDAEVRGNLSASISDMRLSGHNRLALHHLSMRSPSGPYSLDSLLVEVTDGGRRLNLHSDIADAHLSANQDLGQTAHSVLTFIARSFPSLREYVRYTPTRVGIADFRLHLKDTRALQYFLGIPLSLDRPAHVSGYLDGRRQRISLTAWAPSFHIDGAPYSQATLYLSGSADSLQLLTQLTKTFGHDDVRFAIHSGITDNRLTPQIEWATVTPHGTSGTLRAVCQFHTANPAGHIADIHLLPSEVSIKDSLWHIDEARIGWTRSGISLTPLGIRRGDQYLYVSNSESAVSPYRVEFHDIEIAHIQDLLNFHPVDFSGKLSGTAYLPTTTQDKDIPARLTVKDFCFEGGPMGTLLVDARWEALTKRLLIDAVTRLTQRDETTIRGYVDIGQNAISLHFGSRHTPLQFLDSWLAGVIGPVTGTACGQLHLHGPLGDMELEGLEIIDTLSFTPPVTGARYAIIGDTLRFTPDHFRFDGVRLHDLYGGTGTLSGAVTHDHLSDFGYDLSMQADHLHAYHHMGPDEELFWGSIRADGHARLWGTTSAVHAELQLTPRAGSTFYYDSSDRSSSNGTEFIRFHSGEHKGSQGLHDFSSGWDSQPQQGPFTHGLRPPLAGQSPLAGQDPQPRQGVIREASGLRDSTTDIYLTVSADVTPETELVIYTDRKSGDGFRLRGSGPVQARWYNKGHFSLNGLYQTTGGSYQLTMRELLHRTFDIRPGGTLRFSGRADDGDIDLQGVYQVHSVSLSDLNLGAGMSNATTNVNCLLNFSGKSSRPEVSFGLEFPTAGDDLERTLHSVISSQEDLNMQMLYLLTVGRFYTYDYAASSGSSTPAQSTVAMQSLFAGTLGNQLGSFINQALHIKDWQIGPSVSTGRLGWEDMEVGGQLQGSLLQHRLLLNGNFGYREQNTYANNFVGDFNLRYLLNKQGTLSLKAYSETNNRYFSRSSLSTQGGGIQFQRSFNRLSDLFRRKSKSPAPVKREK